MNASFFKEDFTMVVHAIGYHEKDYGFEKQVYVEGTENSTTIMRKILVQPRDDDVYHRLLTMNTGIVSVFFIYLLLYIYSFFSDNPRFFCEFHQRHLIT